MIKRFSKELIVLLMALVLILSMPLNSIALSDTVNDVNGDGKVFYVALGDSITTGMGTSDALNRNTIDISINHKDCSKTSYPYIFANKCIEELNGSSTFDWSNWGIPGYRIEEFTNMISHFGNKGASSYWNLYSYLHEDVINELKNADFISVNIGSNDLLQGFVYDMVFSAFELKEGLNWENIDLTNFADSVKSVKNPLMIELSKTLMGVFIGNENIRNEFKDLIDTAIINAGGIKETNIFQNLLDIIVFVDSNNIERGLKKAANKSLKQYEEFVEYLRQNINAKAKIALLSSFDAYGNSFKASVLTNEDNNPSEAKIQSYTIPSITSRIHKALQNLNGKLKNKKEDAGSIKLDGIIDYLENIDTDALFQDYVDYIKSYKPLVDTYELPAYMSFDNFFSWIFSIQKIMLECSGSIFEWATLWFSIINPIENINSIKGFFSDPASALTIIGDEITYPIRYALLGKPIKKAVNAFNNGVEKLAKDNDLIYVDISGLVGSANGSDSKYSSWNPHPNDFGHKYIANKLIQAVFN